MAPLTTCSQYFLLTTSGLFKIVVQSKEMLIKLYFAKRGLFYKL